MIATVTKPRTDDAAYRWGAFVMLTAAAAIVAALLFQYVGGYAPCPLCLQQRWAYYAGIPASFLALVLLSTGRWRIAALLLFAVALGFLANAGLGVYHAGAEWKFWDGPDSCAAAGPLKPLGSGTGGLLGKLDTKVVRCDEAPWRLFGLSFAGWNVVISLTLTIAAIKAAFASAER